MNILVVDGVTLPTPTVMEYKEADLQSEGYRDEAGYIHKTTVRWGVRSLHVEWGNHLTNEQLSTIRYATRGRESILVNYYADAGMHSGTMVAYCGADMDYKLVRVEDSGKALWKDVTLDLIEI